MGIDSTVGCNVTVGLGGIGVLVNTISVVGVGVEVGFGVEDGAEVGVADDTVVEVGVLV